MNRLFRGLIPLVTAAFLLTGCRHRESSSGQFANAPVILITIDTLRADHLSIYGAKLVDTPAIDRLAADGIAFENAYAHVPLTFPSHATILTGRLPYENGVRSNIGYTLDPKAYPTLPRLLSEHGYATGGAVSAYVLRRDTGLGSLFDFYDDSMEVWESATLGALQRHGGETVRAAVGWLDKVKGRPFFLFLHLFEPHSPYEPVEPFRSKYAANPYDGEIATADAILGQFLADLDRRGLYDKSLIILAGDHGEGLGDHGESEHGVLLYREVLHVPLIVKLPGRYLAGKRVSAPAQLVDILPTITGAVGSRVPDGLPGMSLIDLAEGRARAERKVYSETLYPRLHLGWSQLRSFTDARNHYIESPAPELFDVVADPHETHNVRAERRRDAAAFDSELSKIPLNLQAQKPANSEEMARLSALGYLSGAAVHTTGPLRNPRDHINVLARVQQTFVLNQQKRYSESVALCREILRDEPDLVDVYMQMAGDLRRLGRLAEALEAYREAIRRSPQLVDSVAIEIANVELDLGDLKAAELNAQQAMKSDPASAHLILAAVAEARSDLPSAEREARLAAGPEDRPNVGALVMLARVLASQQRLNEALPVANRAVAHAGEVGAHPVATVFSTRGDILARMGRTAEAEADFRKEIERFPDSTEAYVRLALLFASEHRFAEIGPALEAMVKASPQPATYALAAREMKDLGNDAGARAFRSRGEQLAAALRAQKR
ncbi:MAG TPA: sulfatase-like hydrolase/transferase [Thermoanaerobaculia bacterium]|nr:sulfatase-like hydrolase/transferase [Thermoanaerobaculia bacterium]